MCCCSPTPITVANVHNRTVRRSSRFLSVLINLSTLSSPVAPKMLIWCLCIRGKTGSRCWMMICLNRRLSQEIHFAYPLYKGRIRSATHCHHGFRREHFLPGRRLNASCPELPWLWHHCNNPTVDDSGTICRKRSTHSPSLQLLVPKPGQKEFFLLYHASLYGGHLGRNRTLARLSHRFYWSGMSDDVMEWLGQCVLCVKRKSPTGSHHPPGYVAPPISTSISIYVVNVLLFDMYKEWNWEINILYLVSAEQYSNRSSLGPYHDGHPGRPTATFW